MVKMWCLSMLKFGAFVSFARCWRLCVLGLSFALWTIRSFMMAHLWMVMNKKLLLSSGVTELVICGRAQVVGWPPIRSYRKNTMVANPTKKKEDAEVKQGVECLYIKVSMDGAPYLRKVDLKTYSNYKELSLALEKMFTCFTIGKLSWSMVSIHAISLWLLEEDWILWFTWIINQIVWGPSLSVTYRESWWWYQEVPKTISLVKK